MELSFTLNVTDAFVTTFLKHKGSLDHFKVIDL